MKLVHHLGKSLLNAPVTGKKKDNNKINTLESRKAKGDKHKKTFTGSYAEENPKFH